MLFLAGVWNSETRDGALRNGAPFRFSGFATDGFARLALRVLPVAATIAAKAPAIKD